MTLALPVITEPLPSGGGFSVFVPGRPAPQGSKKHVGRGILVESSKRVKPWRTDVREAVAAALPANWSREGAMYVCCEFLFLRPKSHYTSKGDLTRRAPLHLTARIADADKLLRAVFDAMTSIAYDDDSQIVEIAATKQYARRGQQEGVAIRVDRLD